MNFRGSADQRHLSADAFLNLSCRVEEIAREYCVKNDCSAGQGVEALLSAAAHYAVWSNETATFRRVAEKLRGRIDAMLRDNPEFFAGGGAMKPVELMATRRIP